MNFDLYILQVLEVEDSPDELNSCHLNSPQQQQQQSCVENGELSSDYDESVCDDLSESDDSSWSGGSEVAVSRFLPRHHLDRI